jgi:hypothetical protein
MRRVLAEYLGVPERLNWKDQHLSVAEEEAIAKKQQAILLPLLRAG